MCTSWLRWTWVLQSTQKLLKKANKISTERFWPIMKSTKQRGKTCLLQSIFQLLFVQNQIISHLWTPGSQILLLLSLGFVFNGLLTLNIGTHEISWCFSSINASLASTIAVANELFTTLVAPLMVLPPWTPHCCVIVDKHIFLIFALWYSFLLHSLKTTLISK